MATPAAAQRADTAELERVFKKYASVQKGTEWYMSHEDFVCRYLKLAESSAPSEVVHLLSEVADTTKDRLISLSEFRTFESLLCAPDAVSQLAFRLFDLDNKGHISFENFHQVLSSTSINTIAPFDFDSSFVRQYFGAEKSTHLDYMEFTQLLQSLPTEHARQVFASRDKTQAGTIPAVEFVSLMEEIRGFRMSSYVREHLLSVAGGVTGRKVSYPYFKAFNQLLGNLDILGQVMDNAVSANKGGSVTQAQLLLESQQYAQVTPLQVSLMFQLCSMEHASTGTISLHDFSKLLPPSRPYSMVGRYPPQGGKENDVPAPSDSDVQDGKVSFLFRLLEPMYRFGLGAIAGATGATAVYPIDLVKTRLQNQRGSLAGEIMYKNSFDCAKKVIKGEGFLGLYRGLLPQLVGVSPEKAIKLTANDTMRDLLTRVDGTIPLYSEIIAGGCGGMCQVMFTNPLEIVKIRLQVSGEMAQTAKLGAVQVVKELGFMGLYKGASACFLRDIPFSGIYFPAYAHLKERFRSNDGSIGTASLFTAGFIAGVPAAGLLTPADVIKTRLQVKARKGQQTYNGIADCARKIWKAEGPQAFWKGAPARIFRSSPQFGVTLATYEFLKNLFPMNFKGSSSTPPPSRPPPADPQGTHPSLSHLPDHIGGYKLARPTFAAVESRYGLVFTNPSNTNN